jgi:hypothetical protein
MMLVYDQLFEPVIPAKLFSFLRRQMICFLDKARIAVHKRVGPASARAYSKKQITHNLFVTHILDTSAKKKKTFNDE